LVADIRITFRALRRSPLYTTVATATIGLGIGITTLVFSVVHGVLLNPLPYDAPDRLVNVWNDLVEEQQFLPAVNPADFRDYQEMSETFEAFAAGTGPGPVGLTGVLTGDGPPVKVDVTPVTHNFFSLLGIDPMLGRHFTEEEEAFRGPSVAIISHELWSSRFAQDRDLVGKTFQMDGRGFTVVGVLPRGFRLLLPNEAFQIRHADVWVPLQQNYANLPPRNWTWFTVLGRLRDGVTLAEAQAEMNRIADELRATYPAHAGSGMEIRLMPFQHDIVKAARPALLTLFGAVAFVLLITCANVAHLMLLRGTARQREVALRSALGASRLSIIRQMLMESLVLAALGGALGLGLAAVGLDVLVALQPPNLPRLDELAMSGQIFAFAAGVAVLSAVVFGIVPAVHTSRTDVHALLKDGGRSGRSRGAVRFRQLLVGGEIAVSLVLLVGTGLMIRSFAALQRVDPGFQAAGVLTFRLSLPRNDYPTGRSAFEFGNQLRARITTLPGVTAAGAITQLPLTGPGPLWPYAYDDETLANANLTAEARNVAPGYFEAMGMRLMGGRFFTDQDVAGAEPVVIIDEMLARRAWPDGDAVGQSFTLTGPGNPVSVRVVGVLQHPRLYDLTSESREQVYVPQGQRGGVRNTVFTVRTDGDPAALADAVRNAVWEVDANLPVDNLRPMTAYVDDAMAAPQFALVVMTLFGGLALVLAAVGIYGVISYSVGLRAHEFGIRMALGASPKGVVHGVVAGAARLVGVALLPGIAVSVILSRTDVCDLVRGRVGSFILAGSPNRGHEPRRRVARGLGRHGPTGTRFSSPGILLPCGPPPCQRRLP
jgi:predicted permease